MKKLFTLCFIVLSSFAFSQNKIATTENGKRVLLRDNNTWEYIDSNELSKEKSPDSKCNLAANYVEPKSEKSVESWLRRFDATLEDLRKHIAVENDCDLKNIKFLNISEQKGNGMYSVCVKGTEMKYKRMGTVFMKSDQDPFSKK